MKVISLEQKEKKKKVTYDKWGIYFIIPFFVIYLIFTLVPQLLTVIYSFCEYYMKGLSQVGPNFAGFKNYINIFTPLYGTIDVIKYFGNTMVMWIMGAIPQFAIALLLAVMFTSTRLNLKGQGFFKTVFYLPNVIMASAFSLLVFQIFDLAGPINQILVANGAEKYNFLAHEVPVKSLIAMMNFVMWFGNTTIVLMAGIQGIDESLFESARIDGASSFKVFKDITMPLLKPIFVYCFITSMIGGMQMFDAPSILTNKMGTPDSTSKTMVMYLNDLLRVKNYGRAGAVSMVLFVITGILSLIVYRFINKED